MASYSNSRGDIQFFSNGLRIFDKDSRIIENGSGLNPAYPPVQNFYSFPVYQAGFFLKNPGDSSIVYLFHLDYDQYPPNSTIFIGQYLRMTTIDARANGGKGKVIEKNKVLINNILSRAAAVRHANGRDWWIMASESYEDWHHCLLLTPEGITRPVLPQHIGSKPVLTVPDQALRWTGVGKFSPQGRYYLDLTPEWGFSLYDFDRCTGLLSNERRVNYTQIPTRDVRGGSGIEFSPDERFLYLTSTHGYSSHPAFPRSNVAYMIQYDLTAPEWWRKGDTLTDIPPGPYGYGPGEKYYDQQLLGSATGPDGRIYISNPTTTYCTVQYPDRKGKAALFRYNNPDFKNNIYRGIPSLPNYRLGPLDGSPCDTLGLNNVPVANFRMDTPDSSDLQTRYFYNLSHHEPATWEWDFGDGSPRSTDTSALHLYEKPGKYRVCLTVTNRYGSDTHCREVYVGIVSSDAAGAVREGALLMPNPADEGTVLYLREPPPAGTLLVVSDVRGGAVLRRPVSGAWTDVATAGWPPGVYFVRLEQSGRSVWAGKLVVVR